MRCHRRPWTLGQGLWNREPAPSQVASVTRRTWQRCAAFVVAGHRSVLFLYDSSGLDGDQEYVVMVRTRRGIIGEVDSITVNSFAVERIAWLIDQFLDLPGETVELGSTIRPEQLKTPRQHRESRCPLCS